jgi:outer membrane protein OmpA-like peptidoglycan-associated protein
VTVGTGVTDHVMLTGNDTGGSPTGSVAFVVCGPLSTPSACASGGAAVGDAVTAQPGPAEASSATSAAFTPTAAGTWCFRAGYTGDSSYMAATDVGVGQCFTVTAGSTPPPPAGGGETPGSPNGGTPGSPNGGTPGAPVQTAPPTATVGVSPAAAGLTYTLSAAGSTAATGHQLIGYVWTISGQRVGTAKTLTYTFAKAGSSYRVTLTVTDDTGQTATTTITVTPRSKIAHVSAVVRFARNQAALNATARQTLKPLRGLIRYATTVTLNGYCAANEPSRHHLLLKLSRQRAQTVRAYLFSADKHPRQNVTVTGKGATDFVATNRTEAGRAKNRRATISFDYVKPTNGAGAPAAGDDRP